MPCKNRDDLVKGNCIKVKKGAYGMRSDIASTANIAIFEAILEDAGEERKEPNGLAGEFDETVKDFMESFGFIEENIEYDGVNHNPIGMSRHFAMELRYHQVNCLKSQAAAYAAIDIHDEMDYQEQCGEYISDCAKEVAVKVRNELIREHLASVKDFCTWMKAGVCTTERNAT